MKEKRYCIFIEIKQNILKGFAEVYLTWKGFVVMTF